MTHAMLVRKIADEYSIKRNIKLTKAGVFKKEVYDKNPELYEIDEQIASVAIELSKKMIQSGDKTLKNRLDESLKALKKQKDDILYKNGLTENSFVPDFDCKKCEDTGFIKNEMCSCFKERLIKENFKNSNLCTRDGIVKLKNFSLDYYDDEVSPKYNISSRKQANRILDVAKKFVSDFDNSKNLFLTGAPGLGKTFLSSCIANELIEKSRSVVYISASDFFDKLSNEKFSDKKDNFDLFCDCDLLIIDDLGTEFKTSFSVCALSNILDKRINLAKKMIFSTNLTLKETEEFYNERITSRLVGYFTYLLFFGKDIRVKKLNEL